jgi:hypothetical protein
MGKQIVNTGLMSDKISKPKPGQLDALSAAQLVACINDGRTVKVLKKVRQKAKLPAPLFESSPKQENLFSQVYGSYPDDHDSQTCWNQ